MGATNKTGLGCLGVLGVLVIIGWLLPSPPASTPKPTPTPAASIPAVAPATSAPPAPVVPTELDNWIAGDTTSEMDSSKGFFMSLKADNTIEGWLKRSQPTLNIRCKEGRTQVYVITEMSASVEYGADHGEHHVRLRLDDLKPFRQTWQASTDEEALFAPSGRNMALSLSKAKTFRFEFTPFNGSPQIAVFTLTGINRHLPKLAQTCGWKASIEGE